MTLTPEQINALAMKAADQIAPLFRLNYKCVAIVESTIREALRLEAKDNDQ